MRKKNKKDNKKYIIFASIGAVLTLSIILLLVFNKNDEKTIKTLNVSFDSAGGSSIQGIKLECGKELILPEPPVKDGFIFDGWVDKNEMPILDHALFTCEDVNLIARWKELKKDEVMVLFNTDNGTKINPITIKKGSTIKLPNNPVKKDYRFLNWELNGKKFDPNTKINENITLKAIYQKINYVTVSFNSDGGSTVADIRIEKGTKLTLPGNPYLKDAGFRGWFYSDYKQAKNGDIINENITLKAKWEKAITYTITFDSDGGSKVSSIQIENGKAISGLPIPTKTDYNFVGWYDGTTKIDNNYIIKSNITLKAKWDYKYCKITFNSDGGFLVDEIKIEKGKTISYLPAPTKINYTFDGWYNEGTKVVVGYEVKKDITLIAKWNVEQLRVTLKHVDGSTTYEIINKGSEFIFPTPKYPNDGYDYSNAKWMSGSNNYNVGDKVKVDSAITFTASADNNKVTIKFYDEEGGTLLKTVNAKAGSKCSSFPSNPTKTGKIFVNWYYKYNKNKFAFNSNTSIPNIKELIVYANYKNKVSITALSFKKSENSELKAYEQTINIMNELTITPAFNFTDTLTLTTNNSKICSISDNKTLVFQKAIGECIVTAKSLDNNLTSTTKYYVGLPSGVKLKIKKQNSSQTTLSFNTNNNVAVVELDMPGYYIHSDYIKWFVRERYSYQVYAPRLIKESEIDNNTVSFPDFKAQELTTNGISKLQLRAISTTNSEEITIEVYAIPFINGTKYLSSTGEYFYIEP